MLVYKLLTSVSVITNMTVMVLMQPSCQCVALLAQETLGSGVVVELGLQYMKQASFYHGTHIVVLKKFHIKYFNPTRILSY